MSEPLNHIDALLTRLEDRGRARAGEKAATDRVHERLAPRVIRTGERIAGRLGAKWYAVHVATPQARRGGLAPCDSDALQQNIKLAESLGATVVTVKAERPADGLIAFAQREGITHVIFGQSARSRWELLWRGSTIERFLSSVRDAAVQVVPLHEQRA